MSGGAGGAIIRLGDSHEFPDPAAGPRDGPIAIGGDLSTGRLLAAYAAGIFPWPISERAPLLWWSPDPRFVLFPSEIHVSRRLERTIRSGRFEVRFDTAFEQVIDGCADRPRGTWITGAMREAYVRLHNEGHAHCVECWRQGRLAGGIYGIAMGAMFFGESMFHRERDASKVALVALARRLDAHGYTLLDCQQRTAHLATLGARAIPRREFLARLRAEPGSLVSLWA